MFIGSRVESEWRVEGESHSLTDATWLLVLVWSVGTACRCGSTLGIMGLFKGACESKSPYYVMGLFGNPLRHATDFPWESFTNRPQRFQVQERL